MTPSGQPAPASPPATEKGVPAAMLVAGLFLVLGVDNLLVLRFLGIGTPILYACGAALLGLLCMASRGLSARIPVRRCVLLLGVAFGIMLLGGEGRVFYANPDWQARDAVITDMMRMPWPYLYVGHGEPVLLRLPLGQYFFPALGGKLLGVRGADVILLAQNSLVIGAILSLGSLIVDAARQRVVLLVVVVGFSGLDTIGQAITDPMQLVPLTHHIESWLGVQFSAVLTVAFWAPQHGVSGWIGALFFLLWRRGLAPLGLFLAVVPLTAIWSPLGTMGTMPFVLLAGLDALRRRTLRIADLAWPIAAVVLAVVPLQYMRLGSAHIGVRWLPIPWYYYLLFELVEALPFLIATWIIRHRDRGFDKPTYWVVSACLLIFPFVMLGTNVDFQMRASIPAITILAVMVAEALAPPAGVADNAAMAASRRILIAALLIGALTPAREVARAILFRPSPVPGCDVWKAMEQTYAEMGKETYFARLHEVPARLLGPNPAQASPIAPPRCWDRDWQSPR